MLLLHQKLLSILFLILFNDWFIMNDLNELIDKYGQPDALIDNYNLEFGYAVWGYDETYHYSIGGQYHNNNQLDLSSFNFLDNLLGSWCESKSDIKVLGFLSYDVKNIFYPHLNFKNTDTSVPYIWFIKPKVVKPYFINTNYSKSDDIPLYQTNNLMDLSKYQKLISEIKCELKAGNTYQINLTMQQIFEIHKNPLDIYLQIRNFAKPRYGYYLNIGGQQILSFSPEEFFHTNGSTIYSYPMKGTIRRSENDLNDKQLKKELSNSIKDQSEHIMIVDLLRNDLGKICKYGSVKVKDLFSIQSYPTVHQMVSCISGEMKRDIQYSDIFKALCPGGSITGAPKESSMQIIDRLENYNRGLYTGNIGYIDNNNNMHFNIAIRTMIVNQNKAQYCVGGGIVWDSDYKKEWKEAELKAAILNKFRGG